MDTTFNVAKPGKAAPAQKFVITVPVKPYVKRFIELNYGNPAWFHPDKADYSLLRDCLKESRKYDKRFPELCTYSERVSILISERDFYRVGWEMTRTNVVRFGTWFEMKAKTLMRSMVGIYHGLGLPMNVSITKFQDRFLFDEEAWPYQSIKKDLFRHTNYVEIDFDNEIFNKVEKIVMTNLYKKGTISPQYFSDYEHDQ